MVAKVASGTYPGDKIDYSVVLGEDMLKIVRFDPPEAERSGTGEEVRVRFPWEGCSFCRRSPERQPPDTAKPAREDRRALRWGTGDGRRRRSFDGEGGGTPS